MTSDDINFLATDISEMVLEKTNINEEEQEKFFEKIRAFLDDFFGFPEYNNYN